MNLYLLKSRGYFHARVRVPSGLSVALSPVETVKFLKIKDKKAAIQVALFIRQRITKTISLFCFGILTGEYVRDSVSVGGDWKIKMEIRIRNGTDADWVTNHFSASLISVV